MRLALAGDTMLGRGVAERLDRAPPQALFSAEVVEAAAGADLRIVNLECCISERGRPAPGRVFHFRAPPAAVEALA
ncbi:MAG TPA: CapA family protein, partial [Solirubrobacterales bacterium]|nr:CapA family protein [Solirubrobacterales bacterium]